MSTTSTTLSHGGSDNGGADNAHLQRRLGKLNMVALTFAILNTWIALAGVLGLILPSGGPVALIYGFVFCVLCNLCLVASLGELASIWPTAGGQYHFAYMLSTERWRRLASFCVAWLSTAGWLMLVTTAGYFGALLITAATIMATDGAYVSAPWRVYLIFVGIMIFTTVFNLYGNTLLARWNNFALYWSLLALVVLCVTLLATSKKNDASYVFTTFQNSTGWDNGLAWIFGTLQSALSLIGSDAATHMSEEMPNPAKDTPRAMVYSIIVGGFTGLVFILVLLFCLQDIQEVLSSATGMPITELIYRSTGSRAAATILTLVLAICFINGTNGAVTAVSRLIYSLARDGGVPCSNYFAKIDGKWNVPSRAIMACFGFNLLFGLLYLGPAVAFNAYIACTTILLNVSYAAPILILLIRGRKVLGQEVIAYKLGRMGLFCNVVAVAFVVFTSVFFCFPTALPVTSNTMNYVSAVIGIFVVFLVVTWMFKKQQYQGPSTAIMEGIPADVQIQSSDSGEAHLEKGSLFT